MVELREETEVQRSFTERPAGDEQTTVGRTRSKYGG